MFLINLLAIVAPIVAAIAIVRAEMTRREVQALNARVLELRAKLRAVEAAEDAKRLAAMVERKRVAAPEAPTPVTESAVPRASDGAAEKPQSGSRSSRKGGSASGRSAVSPGIA